MRGERDMVWKDGVVRVRGERGCVVRVRGEREESERKGVFGVEREEGMDG